MLASHPRNPWFPFTVNQTQGRLRLFCFPYAGGGASIFRTWSNQLSPEIEVWPVQLPGRETRLLEPGIAQIEDLVPLIAEALLPHLDKPYAFFGHSMGALVCFELLRQLRRSRGVALPLRLIVSGRRAPHRPDTGPQTYNLSDDEFIAELRRLKGTPEEVLQNTDLLQIVLPTLRADFTLCETYTYRPKEPLTCPITAIGGLEDSEVSRADLAAWNELTTAKDYKMRLLPGDHFFLHQQQAMLLRVIMQDIFSSMARHAQ
ncbi:hypothetical protein KDA_40010 [Dictyobacter alpinus]|uniref:Thioesterase domain-containing protein n=1 Tax=Dictyobacter alpinus TaxID=2014873 RepID=A0A402BB67_9CHLR|nr:thioesterase II family protein [Dictyobacter alpinus]GCE28517.1 hypothetical protein KDA_40010 [Dictyobacter alpinus]